MMSKTVLVPLVAALFLGLSFPFGARAEQILQSFQEDFDAPDIVLENLDGQEVSLDDFRGRVVVVNFWATWCPPCRKEMPSMQRAWEKMQEKDVMMLAVHVGGNTDQVWEFASEFALEFPILIDASSAVSRAWPMRGLPTTFVVDPDGEIAFMALGGREWDDPELLAKVFALRK